MAKKNTTILDKLSESLKDIAIATPGDQEKPCAVLWTDPDKQWESSLDCLKKSIPELFVLGKDYSPENKTGPAIWLRCIEGRTIDPKLEKNKTPIFYLPGYSKFDLQDLKNCPAELQPIAEMQFRGAIWLHPNGKDWTPMGFLVSDHGGLGLDVAKDEATAIALKNALAEVLSEPVSDLHGKRLDADYFNGLLAPDLIKQILAWLDSPQKTKAAKDARAWQAFCEQCKKEYGFHPDKDGELHAAELLGKREDGWVEVWKRFCDAPAKYPGIEDLLDKASPAKKGIMLELPEGSWPSANKTDEKHLQDGLKALKNLPHDKAAEEILALEKTNAKRRDWVWAHLGKAPLAQALRSLCILAEAARKPLSAPSAAEIAELYTESGWEVDSAAITALSAVSAPEDVKAVCIAVRSVYLNWLEESARNLQRFANSAPASVTPEDTPIECKDGRVILFADGLRMDVARRLEKRLKEEGLTIQFDWDWSPFPSITATAKYFVSPVKDKVKAAATSEDFGLLAADSNKPVTKDRFVGLMNDAGVGPIYNAGNSISEKTGWFETGTIDEHGHNDGWKLSKSIEEEVSAIVAHIKTLLSKGWKEVLIVTDHGWLMMPGGLPKISLPAFLTENRWGRCAAIKDGANVEMPTLPWHWDNRVRVAYPPGVGCFKAGLEYAHGGVSPQEMVVPRILITAGAGTAAESRIASLKWVGLRGKMTVEGMSAGLTLDIRQRPADPSTSLIEGGTAKPIGADGTVSIFISDDRNNGIAAIAVLISSNGAVIHSLPTVIGETK
ncbi:MAG: BREX-1 system phosphatase PglZ type B [Elusimicrobiota bacterium]